MMEGKPRAKLGFELFRFAFKLSEAQYNMILQLTGKV
jgi:hypothetical protein